jgi:trimeric autotransporter adhesin
MSTKTTFKRIALVAVASLGFGVLTSVAPANAAEVGVEGISVTTPTVTVNVGTAATSTFSLDPSAALANTNDIVVTPTMTVPTASVLTVARKSSAAASAGTTEVLVNTGEAFTAAGATVANTTSVYTLTATGATEAVSTVAGTISFTPDVPGNYVVTLTTAAAGTNTSRTATFTVVARSLSYKTGDGTAVAPFSTGNGIAGPANTVTVTALPTGASGVRALVTVTGSTILSGTNSAVVATGGASAVITAGTTATDLVIPTPAVGTITVSLFNETGSATGIYSATAANTVTITVNAAAVTGVVVAANSTSLIGSGTTEATTVDATAVTASAVASTAVAANITVVLKDSATNTNSSAFLTASIAGPGTVGIVAARSDVLGAAGTNNVYGKNVTGATTANRIVNVYSDGTPGVATITISAGTTVIGVETVTFVGPAASYVATQTRGVYAGTTAPTTPGAQTITVAVKDAAGNNVVNGTTVFASSATTTVATITASTTTTSGVATFTVTGAAAGTSVITFGNAASSPTVSTTTTITVGSATFASVTMTTDKASYLPGERMTLTVAANSAAGTPVADGDYTLFSVAPTSSMALAAGTLPTASAITLKGGVATYLLNAPVTEGAFTISGKDALTAANTISVTDVVENAAATTAATAAVDAAAEATDAANAATDAANAAAEAADAATAAAQDAADAVAALSTQVTELVTALRRQITSLTNLVIKIQRKVRA